MRRQPGAVKPRVTVWRHVRAIVLLPLTNTVAIPALIVASTAGASRPRLAVSGIAAVAALAIGAAALAAGLALVVRSISLFRRCGDGTLAPWDPTRRLVTHGVYAHSRNPMKAGLFLILIGETLVLRSAALAVWAALFIAVNVAYIRLSEEPGLRARFGASYDAYARRVPRWLPRRSAALASPSLREGEPR